MIIGPPHRTDSSSKKKAIQRKDISSPKPIQFPVVQAKKFPSPPPSPLNTTPKPHDCSPLGCNPFFAPSASVESQPPSSSIDPRAPLNNIETTPSYCTSLKPQLHQQATTLLRFLYRSRSRIQPHRSIAVVEFRRRSSDRSTRSAQTLLQALYRISLMTAE
jgi:hypothetical protein